MPQWKSRQAPIKSRPAAAEGVPDERHDKETGHDQRRPGQRKNEPTRRAPHQRGTDAKKAAAALSRSRSCVSRRFSRRSRRSSSRSSLVRPSARPASTSPWRRQFLSVLLRHAQLSSDLLERRPGPNERYRLTTELRWVRRTGSRHLDILPARADRPKHSSVHASGSTPERCFAPGCESAARGPALPGSTEASKQRRPAACRAREWVLFSAVRSELAPTQLPPMRSRCS